jgi:two-component system sensor histidine kinase MtrB
MTPGGFRRRLTLVVMGLVAVTVILVASVSFVLVRASLRSQLVDAAAARAEFNIGVLASEDLLPPRSDRAVFEASGLAERFLFRGTNAVYVEFGNDDPYYSSIGVLSVPELLSDEYREIVASGEVAYEFVDVGELPSLVVGAIRPPDGPEFTFVFDASELAVASSRLARFTAGAAAIVLVVGLVAARAIAGRVLRPVGLAADAAGRMAAGDLHARVPVESGDEFGAWAGAFNAMAEALEEKVTELEAARERERRFVADVSHELRTPLTSLVTEAELLGPQLAGLEPAARRAGELLVTDVARLRRLVDDLLEISRLEAPAGGERLVETDLRRFVRALVDDRHPAAEWVVHGSSAPVLLDRRGLERVVGNILDNARLHAPGARVWVEATIDGGMLTAQISDDGPGVPAEHLDRLFDRFSTVDEARSGGAGLGLAIARGHARRMGGDLVVRPRTPSGLAFELTVPVTEPLHDGEGDATSKSDDEGTEPERRAP